jgi:iron(III) transport system ATP-binding protein
MFLQVNALQVHYPGRQRAAVDSVSLQLQAGQMGVLIGPSGCRQDHAAARRGGFGKNQAPETSVSMVWSSAAMASICPLRSAASAWSSKSYALFPHLNVAQNIAFGLHRWPLDRQRARVKDVLALVGLDNSGQRYAHELSGGQQQRVALARALAPQPQLLLLDEPFSNLDVDLRERLAHELRSILRWPTPPLCLSPTTSSKRLRWGM